MRIFDWHTFIEQAKEFFKVNFMPFLLLLSGGIAAFHYKKMLETIKCCPAASAVGDTSSGKSTALTLVGKLMGMHMVSQSSGEFIISDLTKSTIPLCWDDPTHPSILRSPLVSVFNGHGSQTQERGDEKPLTTFLLAINFELKGDMRSFERTTPIWFNKLSNVNGEGEFLESRRRIIVQAPTVSLMLFPWAINYTMIITLVDDDDVISRASFDKYLTNDFLPYVKSFYDVSVKAYTALDEIFLLLLQAIATLKLKKNEVAKWMRPMVRSNKNKNVFSIVFVIPSALDVIHLAKLDDPPTEKNVRDLVSKADGAKGEYKSAFQGHERKISCVKVPRHNFSNEILLQIDELFEMANNTETDEPADEESCKECKKKKVQLEEIENKHEKEKEDMKQEWERKIENLMSKWSKERNEKENQIQDQTKKIETIKRQLKEKEVECLKLKSQRLQHQSLSQSNRSGSVTQALDRIVETEPLECATPECATVEEKQLDDSGIGDDMDVIMGMNEGGSSHHGKLLGLVD
ncbi:Hypothetical predicted protein [Paramuricea clavata]|uniref:Uncharacterized protein n=1 Tax=Paramuricea clavata TaxID=317549 RepID=A0A7D9DQC0_PARCT|nr:Hypothetical predicted protein [Paramuricea clavata]